MALVLAEIVAGSAVLLWFSPLWGEVKRGFFKLMGVLLFVLGLLAWVSASAGLVPGDFWGEWSVRLAIVTAGCVAIWTILLFARQPPLARAFGFIGAALAATTLVFMAGTGRSAMGPALFQLVAGAAFLGSVVDCLMLGHWYLTDRGLARRPIERYTRAMLVGVGAEIVAVVSGGFAGTASSPSFNPLLTVGALAPWIALGMSLATGLIAVLARAALKGERASAVQSATGFYYLAVVTSLTAELAVKTRFFAS